MSDSRSGRPAQLAVLQESLFIIVEEVHVKQRGADGQRHERELQHRVLRDPHVIKRGKHGQHGDQAVRGAIERASHIAEQALGARQNPVRAIQDRARPQADAAEQHGGLGAHQEQHTRKAADDQRHERDLIGRDGRAVDQRDDRVGDRAVHPEVDGVFYVARLEHALEGRELRHGRRGALVGTVDHEASLCGALGLQKSYRAGDQRPERSQREQRHRSLL